MPADEVRTFLGNIDDAELERLIARFGFSKAFGSQMSGLVFTKRQYVYRRSAVNAWRADIVAVAARLKK
jgi:hypothetical protein